MKQKNNGGYSLIEVLVAISILGIIVSPVCANLLMSLRATEKTDEILQAQLAVSSAVETLMAEGIGWEEYIGDGDGIVDDAGNVIAHDYYDNSLVYTELGYRAGYDRFPVVKVQTWSVEDKPYYKVLVESENVPSVSVETYIHAVDVSITPINNYGEGEGA